MHTEKEKRKNKPLRWYWAKRIFGICLVGFVALLGLGPMPTENEIKTSLDAAFLPTAEYLLKHPQSEYEQVDLYVEQNPNYFQRICVNLGVNNPAGDLRNATEIYLNASLVKFPWYTSLISNVGFTDGALIRCAIELQLERGTHLLEVRMKYRWYEEPFHIHQWAFEIK